MKMGKKEGKSEESLVCTSQVPVDLVYECPDGSPFHGVCHRGRNVPAEHTCPAGYHHDPDHTCSRVDKIDCGAPTSGHKHRHLRAEDGEVTEEHAHGDHKHHGNNWDGETHSNMVSAYYGGESGGHGHNKGEKNDKWNNWQSDKVHGKHEATPKIIHIDHVCHANVSIPATPFCSIGMLRGEFCVVQEPVEPRAVCPAYGSLDNCFGFERKSPKAVCPDDFTQECVSRKGNLDHCDCVRHQILPIQLVCPAGSALLGSVCVRREVPTTGCLGSGKFVDGQCLHYEYAASLCTYSVNFACQGPYCRVGTTGYDLPLAIDSRDNGERKDHHDHHEHHDHDHHEHHEHHEHKDHHGH